MIPDTANEKHNCNEIIKSLSGYTNIYVFFSNVFLYVESENNIVFLKKWIDKKLVNF